MLRCEVVPSKRVKPTVKTITATPVRAIAPQKKGRSCGVSVSTCLEQDAETFPKATLEM